MFAIFFRGGTNPKEIRQLQNFGVKIRQLNDLHAKVGVVGGFSFLGSSNMSTNGLGDEGSETGWQEANVTYSRERPEIVEMIETFWEKASEIKEADLKKAELAWSTRRKGNAASKAQAAGLSIVEMLRTQPGVLDDLSVRMVVYDTVTTREELEILDAADRQAQSAFGDAFEVYWGWDSLVTEASQSYLVDFDWPARGSIARGALYFRDTSRFADFEKDGEKFQVVHEVDSIEGIKFTASDKAQLKKAFHEYVRAGNMGEEPDHSKERSYNFPISELAPFLPPL